MLFPTNSLGLRPFQNSVPRVAAKRGNPGPVVLAVTLGLLQTFKQENDEGQDMSAQRPSLLIDLSRDLTASQDEVRTK